MHVVNYSELGYKSHFLKWFSISYVLNFPNLSPRETRFILKRYTFILSATYVFKSLF